MKRAWFGNGPVGLLSVAEIANELDSKKLKQCAIRRVQGEC